MTQRKCVIILASILAMEAWLPASKTSASEPINVVTIFIDDMGWSDLSCFGGERVETEHLDRLAEEGIRFTNFYVNSPICSPSRVALSTGQYPQRWRITSYLAARKLNRSRGVAQWLDPSAPILGRQLQQAGYATGHFGKWHMGGQRDVGDAPLISDYGFDESLTNFEGLGPRVLPLKDAYDGRNPQKHDLGSGDLGRGPIRWLDRSVVTKAFVDEAVQFIDEATRDGKPFYLNLWPDDVHSPFFPPEAFRKQTNQSKRQLYYAVLDAMDEQIGGLLNRIRSDERLRRTTLVLVMSDNGHEDGAGSSAPLRGSKTWLYEGGIRSPLIAWGPGVLAPQAQGTTNDHSILCALDINRSLYSLTGASLPPEQPLDGEDLVSTLLGKRQDSRQAPIFWRRPPDRPGSKSEDNPDLAVRSGKWKYLCNYDESDRQLFDLEQDIDESTNVIAEHPEIASELQRLLMAWNRSMPADAGDPTWTDPNMTGPLDPELFVNPIAEGADPWVTRDPNEERYLWCLSEGNRAIAMHASRQLASPGRKHIVWRAPNDGPYSKEVWAPELHFLDGHWHIYFAASDGDNRNHLAYVLKSKTKDPLGEYELHGPLATGDGPNRDEPNIWAIDMTILEKDQKQYAIWSGWDAPGSDQQYLYIAEMNSPTELIGPRTRLCDNADHLWERTEPNPENRGLNEAPQVFQSQNRTFVTYSCGASWLPTYKLGMLELVGENPLLPESWQKRPQPVFQSNQDVYGVGHSCAVRSLDDRQWWHVFHAKRDRRPGWRRAVFVQRMRIGKAGQPLFGKPVAPGSPIQVPSNESPRESKLPLALSPDLTGESDWSYYGHHQFIHETPGRIELGSVPEAPINEYRSGEKIVLKQRLPSDLRAEVLVDFFGDSEARDAGILFRCSGPAVGFDAQRGYFAGLIPRTQLVILGKTDGVTWRELARAEASIDAGVPQQLAVQVNGDSIRVDHNGQARIQIKDQSYESGTLGLRVVNTRARFSNLRATEIAP